MKKAKAVDIAQVALTDEQVSGEAVQVRFVPLSVLQKLGGVLWQKNAKKHDPKGIIDSIERYGFIDPPKWDANLNDGQGGIIYGNGRTEAIVAALLTAQKEGAAAPRGIPTAKETGEWCIPVKFGVDAGSEAQAMAAAIDHNNLTLSGGEFDAAAIAQIWDNEGYLAVLTAISEEGELPVTVDEDDLASLLDKTPNFDPASFEEQGDLDHAAPKEMICICPNCHHEFIQKM